MVKSSDILRDKSLGGLACRYLAPFGRHFDFFVTSIFISMTLDGVTSFSRIKTYEIHANASITKLLAGFLHVMAENWINLKDTTAFTSFLVC